MDIPPPSFFEILNYKTVTYISLQIIHFNMKVKIKKLCADVVPCYIVRVWPHEIILKAIYFHYSYPKTLFLRIGRKVFDFKK